MSPSPSPVDSVRASLGEHPVRLTDGSLAWVDIGAGDLYRLRPDGTHIAQHLDEGVGCAAPAEDGGVIVATSKGFQRLDAAGSRVGAPIVPDDLPIECFFNDGACDPAGRFLAGTSTTERTIGAATLYALEPDGTVRAVLEGVTESNGIAWSPDGGTMYYVDSGTQDVLAFPYDVGAGRLGTAQVVTAIDPADGVPDGLAVDVEGNLWLGLWDGWGMRRYTPSGTLLDVVSFPVQHVTCAGFGGPDLDVLYVATASSYLSDGERAAQPLAGALFRVDGIAPGHPVWEFG